ncbi:MAG: hypothetical protein IJV14_10795 [Lachnospiraceae bacterium]|nr:hypothetical protein [Lachnospiraceae bacterium]
MARRFDLFPGVIVRVRSWDDMAEEFGVESGHYIPCSLSFTKEMQRYCGNEYEIEEKYDDEIILKPHYDGEFRRESGYGNWLFSADMLELVMDESPLPDTFSDMII